MLKADLTDLNPIQILRFLNATRGGNAEVCRLPILQGQIYGLPPELDALIFASDLQGIVPAPDGKATLLGVAVADCLEKLEEKLNLPHFTRTGIILAGDLYSVPEANKRGGFGDVTEVWEAFGSRFAWTACVLGNHDHPGRSGAVGHLIRAGKLPYFRRGSH